MALQSAYRLEGIIGSALQLGIIAVLFVMYRSQKKKVGLKQQEIEQKEAEDKSTNNYKNDRIDELEREIEIIRP